MLFVSGKEYMCVYLGFFLFLFTISVVLSGVSVNQCTVVLSGSFCCRGKAISVLLCGMISDMRSIFAIGFSSLESQVSLTVMLVWGCGLSCSGISGYDWFIGGGWEVKGSVISYRVRLTGCPDVVSVGCVSRGGSLRWCCCLSRFW